MQMTKREVEKLRKLRALAALAALADAEACESAYEAVNCCEDNAGDKDGSNTFKEALNEYQNAPTYGEGVLRLDKILDKYDD